MNYKTMKRGILFKVVQRQTLTCLSHQYGIYFAFAGIVIILYSMFQFGEELMIWSQSQYDSMFSFYHDNIAGISYREQLTSPIPIDIVYTWVNGSDPNLIQSLNKVMLESTLNDNNDSLLATMSSTNQPLDCNLADCLTLPCIVVPTTIVTGNMQLLEDSTLIKWRFDITSNNGFIFKENSTILRFESSMVATDAVKELKRKNISDVSFMQITSEVNAENTMKLEKGFILSGIPGKLETNELIEKLPNSLIDNYEWVHMDKAKNVAFIWAKDASFFDDIINAKGDANQLEIDGHSVEVRQAYVVNLNDNYQQSNEASKSRFEDNEELRYSLRSVERYAPWVRNIFIVTNGQIPHWLNIDNPRITIITHEEIFPNISHLPSFSSPSIESHLHRIPGLSQKFIYFNDDVMFGKEVWPDDFYTHSFGQKVYLTWSVPNCNEGCAASWIKDGFCDSACNVSACMWDGGDCIGKNVKAGIGGNSNDFQNAYRYSSSYCHTGCSNSWLADKYCDQACNHPECAFDAGDCGISRFNEIYRFEAGNETVYKIPDGLHTAYIDISKVFDKVTSANYDKNDESLRIAAVSNVHHVVVFVFHQKANYTNIAFNITGEKSNEYDDKTVVTMLFNVTAHPAMNVTHEIKVKSPAKTDKSEADVEVEPDETPDLSELLVSEDIKQPKSVFDKQDQNYKHVEITNKTILPKAIQGKLLELEIEHDNGLLTNVGFAKKTFDLVKAYTGAYALMEDISKHIQLENSTEHLKGDVFELTTKSQARSIQQLRKDIQAEKKNTFQDLLQPNRSSVVYGGGRKLMSYQEDGFLPWENDKNFQKFMRDVANEKKRSAIHEKYGINGHRPQRHLLSDSFAESLRYVSHLFNQDFGFNQRKVPAHMPHMIDIKIMAELQSSYPKHFEKTSSHQLRHPEDMQFAFSYFYYLMEKKKSLNISEVFMEIDSDQSGVLSDRELRVLATRLYELPLTLEELTNVENALTECAWELYGPYKNATGIMPTDLNLLNQPFDGLDPSAVTEVYYDKKLPPVTFHLVENCMKVVDMINNTFKKQNKFKYQLMEQDEIAFKMIGSNVSVVVGQLDDIRKKPRKFICLNDNIDHHAKEARMVKAVLGDFYETLFPLTSQFELPPDYRNRFMYKNDLIEWQTHRDRVTFWLRILLALLIVLSFGSMIWDYMYNIWKKHKYKFTRGRNPIVKLWRCMCNRNVTNTSSELIP